MRLLIACLSLLLLGLLTGAEPPSLPLPPDATEILSSGGFIPDPAPQGVSPAQQTLAYSIVMENRTGGLIRVVDPPAQFLLARPGIDLGTVARPALRVDTDPFYASLYGQPQTVVASAVNAVHIKAYDDPTSGSSAVVTILPKDLLTKDIHGEVVVPRDDAVYTNITGGHGIFGGSYPVIVGNPVSIYRNRQHVYFDPENTALEIGDIIIIEVRTPATWPASLTIENREAGPITLLGSDNVPATCGTVQKPVSGTGRFAGGIFSTPGGIRATHTGVLDIDFSPVGQTGGLQLIPFAHSLAPELTYTQESPPYGIVIGPMGSDLRGQAPLFSGYCYPVSGLETPRLLPTITISMQEASNPSWQALPGLIGRQELQGLMQLRLEWKKVEAPPPEPAPGIMEVEVVDVPSFRD